MEPAAACFLASSIIRSRCSTESLSSPSVKPKSEPQIAGYLRVLAFTLSESCERWFGKLCWPERMPLPDTAQRVLSSARASGVALGFTGSQLYGGGAGGRAGGFCCAGGTALWAKREATTQGMTTRVAKAKFRIRVRWDHSLG